MRKPIAFAVLLLTSLSSKAEFSIPGIPSQGLKATALTDKTLARTGLTVNEDDVVASQDANTLKLTETQLHDAEVWGLSLDEEKRYVFLMQNRSSVYYRGRHLTPVDILGINARSEMERTHFAELAARQEAQMVSKNIAWNNAFHKAYNELFEGIPVVGEAFDASLYAPAAYKPVILHAGDNLYFFVKPADTVTTVLLALIDAIGTTADTSLHLMLLGTDDLDIQQWANQNQIPRNLVTNGRIVLHHGEQHFEALTVNKKATPLLLLSAKGATHVVDLGRF